MVKRIATALLLLSSACMAQSSKIAPAARKAIDAGNQAWVDGMKSGNGAAIAKIYAEDALDCGPTGECSKGRAAIEKYLKGRVAMAGRAQSASVTSIGTVQQGDFVYEWGHSEASLANGKKVGGRYLTVWQRQANGSWLIFRNLSIPDDSR
jgi:uncharacterized protein (TIGR02246 family)